MNRINKLFARKDKGVFSTYFCAGHPAGMDPLTVLSALEEGGVDLVEVGIPFSDPLADGKVVQGVATEAIKCGMTLRKLMARMEYLRPTISIPVVLMGYYNVALKYGMKRLIAQCASCGIDGLIIPDLPFDEYRERYAEEAERYGVSFIFLVTPNTDEARIREIDAATDAFIYAVSAPGVTGAKDTFPQESVDYFARLRSMNLTHPFLVGFGISNELTHDQASEYANGIIVGSRFLTLLSETKNPATAIDRLKMKLGLTGTFGCEKTE